MLVVCACGLLLACVIMVSVQLLAGLASTMKVYGEVEVARSEVTGDDDDACDYSPDVFSSL